MSGADIAAEVISALRADGFTSRLSGTGMVAQGDIKVLGRAISLRLEYRDMSFSEPPYVFVENAAALSRPVVPHLDEQNELCVVDRRTFIPDRYATAAQARGVLVKAIDVLTAGQGRTAEAAIAAEFPQHWGGKVIYTELAEAGGRADVFMNRGATWAAPASATPREGATTASVVRTPAQLSFSAQQRRPATLAEVLDWAAAWDADLPGAILVALGGLSSENPLCFIVASNGIVAFRVEVGRGAGDQTISALKRPEGWRAALSTPIIRRCPVTRFQGQPSDVSHLLGRNTHDRPVLAQKHIVLVGCGSVGGFLSQALARMGAGFEGTLTLVDPENFEPANLGRHMLGGESVGVAKATACATRIVQDVPNVNCVGRKAAVQALELTLHRADFIVDATGEQGISEYLNALAQTARSEGLPWPQMLHAWIVGQGSAVQSLISTDPDFGCYRCLQPDHEKPPRHLVLRPEAPREVLGGCGEATFVPYGPSAPLAAAGLAARHLADLAMGVGRPTMRTWRLDPSMTFYVKPTNLTKSNTCPACGAAS